MCTNFSQNLAKKKFFNLLVLNMLKFEMVIFCERLHDWKLQQNLLIDDDVMTLCEKNEQTLSGRFE